MSKYGDLRKKILSKYGEFVQNSPQKSGGPILVAKHWRGGDVNLGPWVVN